MIKKILLGICFLTILSSTKVAAQRYAIVDSKYILSKLTDYTQATKQLNETTQQWEQEISQLQANLDLLYQQYEAERALLSPTLLKKRSDELFLKEKEIMDLQKKRFGFEGDLFKLRQELIQPIQDRVYAAIQRIAAARQYDFILDKSEGVTVIFSDPKLDKSEDILKELGVK